MKNLILSVIQPFDRKQEIVVYQNGNPIDTVPCHIDDLPDSIYILSEKYNINDVKFAGPRQYCSGLSKQIKEYTLNKYNKSNLNIEIV